MRFRSPLLSQSRFLSFPPGTEMVHFPGFARTRLWIHRAVARVHHVGFPHSDIPGSKPACGSPRLIAACHVLHRLLAPRHPPYALSSLTIKLTQHVVGPVSRFFGTTGQKAMSSKLAFPQFALLEQNLQISYHVQDSCESQPRYEMPAYSVVKELCVRPAPGGTFARLFLKRGQNNKKPGVERRAKPSATIRTGSRDARLFSILSS